MLFAVVATLGVGEKNISLALPPVGLYKIGNSCPAVMLKSTYCREGKTYPLKFLSNTCWNGALKRRVWYDGENFYFLELLNYESESSGGELRKLTTSIYWIQKNECPVLRLKNVCNNKIETIRLSGRCYGDANFFYWDGEDYYFGWVKIGVGKTAQN